MRIAHLALVPLLLTAGMARTQDYLSCQLAPGWTQSEPIHQYTADNLYDWAMTINRPEAGAKELELPSPDAAIQAAKPQEIMSGAALLALDAALGKLTDFQRRLIELLFYREFTQREVAEALGVTTKRVSRELGKTLLRLKELMGKRIL